MGRHINLGCVELGEVGRLGPSIITGANLCQRSSKKKPLEAEPDDNSDPLSASTPKEALAMAIKFLEGLKPPDVEEPEEEGS
jgi:hypothetical protein